MKTTYNERTMRAIAGRLRHMKNTLPAMPEWEIVWRWAEGFRLQVEGETHEPGGCLLMSGTDPYGKDLTEEVERIVARADQEAIDCLEAELECLPEKFDDESLRHIAVTSSSPTIARLAWDELGRRDNEEQEEVA